MFHSQETIDLTEILSSLKEGQSDVSCDHATAILIINCNNLLGEGIIFDDRTNTVLWTDILSSKFHSLSLNYSDPSQCLYEVYALPKKLCSFGLIQYDHETSTTTSNGTGRTLPTLCAWEDGFQLYDVYQNKVLSEMSMGEDVNPCKGFTRLNDGRVDPTGRRFICGGFYGNTQGIKMKVYRVEQRKNNEIESLFHEPIVNSVEVTNSICWSLDGNTLYLADSPLRQIHAYDYDKETGEISNKQAFHSKLTEEVGVPDGSCVDNEGYVWNAVWKNGMEPSCVQRIHPVTGKVTISVKIPDTTSQVSCCCFGGKNLDVMFISTASESRDAEHEPYAGGLYAVRLPFRGHPEHKLNFTYSNELRK
jgi:L-arabinonolactonase